MAAPSYDIRIDWNNDGDYSDAGEDVTTRVLDRTTLSMEYGRDQARSLAPMRPGEARLELDNSSRDYSPENTSSPLVGNLGPGRPVRVQATHSAVTYTLYQGYLDDFEMLPDREHKSVALTALDGLGRLGEIKISTALYPAIRTGEAVGYVLDAVGWTGDRDLDIGATTVKWWYEEGSNALDALTRILTAEGPTSLIHIGPDGEFIFRDRHHRVTRTTSTAVQATFRDAGSEPKFATPMRYDAGWRDIVNSVEFDVTEREIRSTVDIMWRTYVAFTILPGETKTWNLRNTQALFIDAITPTQGSITATNDPDFIIASGTGTLSFSLDRTSGQAFRLQVSLPLSGTATTVVQSRLRGRVVDTVATARHRAEDSTSIALHGRRSYSLATPWLDLNDAAALCNIILAQRTTRLPTIGITLVGSNDTRLTQQLSRDLSDRVRVIESELGLDGEFFIDQIQHNVLQAGLVLETEFGCEKVPSQPTSVFTFDVVGRGFDDGRFGQSGLDNPTTVFLFDHVTQGQFDLGLFGN